MQFPKLRMFRPLCHLQELYLGVFEGLTDVIDRTTGHTRCI